MNYNLITILGPTASGKTALAVQLAALINGEIISADSRQVYRSMDIGTGKDLSEYQVGDFQVPYHLIDIVEPGYKYNVFEYQRDFVQAYYQITNQHEGFPILCGGTGMYIEAVLKGYRLINVPENQQLRDSLAGKSIEELSAILAQYKRPHNVSDLETTKRAIRAIEIAQYHADHDDVVSHERYPSLEPLIIGINMDRDARREKITARLLERIDQGLIQEIESLIKQGVSPEDLIYYGLEYKYVTLYLKGELTLQQMTERLETAIHQFAKRQMTWFNGMERRGIKVHWIDGARTMQEKIADILYKLHQ